MHDVRRYRDTVVIQGMYVRAVGSHGSLLFARHEAATASLSGRARFYSVDGNSCRTGNYVHVHTCLPPFSFQSPFFLYIFLPYHVEILYSTFDKTWQKTHKVSHVQNWKNVLGKKNQGDLKVLRKFYEEGSLLDL